MSAGARMYLSHFGLNEPPFRITPHTDFFFDGANRGATLEALLYAITHDEGIVKVSGEVGSGKTMLCRVLMERLPKDVEMVYLANPSLSREEILYAIADELSLELSAERAGRLLRELQDKLVSMFAKGKRVVVLIDEAHAMPKETLEEIRLLSNLEAGHHKLLQIVLFGQPELDELLGVADMRQLKERITHSFRLEPFVKGDIETYIDFRMRAAGYRGPPVFSSRAVRMIAATSQGLTRRVNILADKSLLAAFATNTHGVTHKEARAAIRDSDFYKPQPGIRRMWIAAATLVIGLAVGFSAERLLRNGPDTLQSAAITRSAPAYPSTTPNTAKPSHQENPAADTPAPPQATLPDVAAPPRQSPLESAAPEKSGVAGSQAKAQPVADAAQTTISPAPQAARAPGPASGSVSEPAQQPGATTTASKPQAAASAQNAAPTGPLAHESGKLAQAVFAATQVWLKEAPAQSYAIQLLTVRDTDLPKMERFLQRASRLVAPDDLHLYSVKINGAQHYRAAYGQFKDKKETSIAINELPDFLRAQNPYQRSVERMRSQNKQ